MQSLTEFTGAKTKVKFESKLQFKRNYNYT